MATYFWVGGSGNWDATTTTNWATSSGGAGGAGVPTSADDVIFDANSNTGTSAFTVTVTGTSASPAACANFSTGGAGDLDGAMTLSLGATAYIDVYGSLTLPAANFTWSGTTGSYLRLRGTGSYTITTNGVTITGTQIASLAQGTWTLGSALTTTLTLDWQQGTFNTSNFAISAQQILFQLTGNRTFNAGSSTITLTGVPAFTYSGSNLTFNAGTSTIILSNASPTFSGGGLTFYNLNWTATTIGSLIMDGGNTFNNVTFSNVTAPSYKAWLLSGNNTINGTLTLSSATTATQQVWVYSNILGVQRTLTVATLSTLTNVLFKDIIAAGTSAASPWSGTNIGDAGNNSNITASASRTLYYSYAVGGNWGTGTNVWATSSGGTPSSIILPLPQDTVIIDNNSVSSGNTITHNSNWWSGTIDFTARTLPMTFATASSYVTLNGDFKLSSSVTLTGTNQISFYGYNKTQTLQTAGVSIPLTLYANISGSGTLSLYDNLTATNTSSSYGSIFLVNGTLNLNNNTVNAFALGMGVSTNPVAIAYGTGTFNITGNNTAVINAFNASGYTHTGNAIINCTYSGSTGTRTITHPQNLALAYPITINVTGGSDTVQLYTSTYYGNLDFTGFSGTLISNTPTANYMIFTGNVKLNSNITLSSTLGSYINFYNTSAGLTQVITSAGKTWSAVTQVLFNTAGSTVQLADAFTTTAQVGLTAGTLNLNNNTLTCPSLLSSSALTRAIAFGTGNITTTGSGTVWNTATATGLTYTGTPTVNISNNSAIATTVSAGSATGGTTGAITNAFNFNFTTGTYSLTISGNSYINALNFTGFTGTLVPSGIYLYGSLTLVSGMTFSPNTGFFTFLNTSGTAVITSAGKTLWSVSQNGLGGTVQLADNLTMDSTRTYTLTAGTLDLNSKTLSTGLFSSSNSNVRSLKMNSGTITLSGTGTIWNAATSTNFTLIPDYSNIVLSDTSATVKTFAGGGLTYNNLTIAGGAGGATVTFTGSNKFNTLSATNTSAFTITFTAGTTTTVNNWNVSGTSGNVVTLGSSTTSAYTIAKTGTNVFSGKYLNISYMTASPTTFSAFNSTNGGNNTGVTFDAAGTYARISNSGTLYVPPLSTVFDEITQSNISTTKPAYYAGSFDEVTNPGVPIRYLNNGTVQTQGIIDEITGIN